MGQLKLPSDPAGTPPQNRAKFTEWRRLPFHRTNQEGHGGASNRKQVCYTGVPFIRNLDRVNPSCDRPTIEGRACPKVWLGLWKQPRRGDEAADAQDTDTPQDHLAPLHGRTAQITKPAITRTPVIIVAATRPRFHFGTAIATASGVSVSFCASMAASVACGAGLFIVRFLVPDRSRAEPARLPFGTPEGGRILARHCER